MKLTIECDEQDAEDFIQLIERLRDLVDQLEAIVDAKMQGL